MAIVVDPQDVADLTTLSSVYAMIKAANDLAHTSPWGWLKNDLEALIDRVDEEITRLGEQMWIVP